MHCCSSPSPKCHSAGSPPACKKGRFPLPVVVLVTEEEVEQERQDKIRAELGLGGQGRGLPGSGRREEVDRRDQVIKSGGR